MRPIPETTRAMVKARPCFQAVAEPRSHFPLRAADGRTWAEHAAERRAKVAA